MSRKKDWMNEELIARGFPMERTREVVDEIYAQMMEDDAQGVRTKSETRKGIILNVCFF